MPSQIWIITVEIPYLLMVFASIAALLLAWSIRALPRVSLVIGSLAWISLAAYPVGEFYVMRASTVPYDPLQQPMSDLGVTICNEQPYSLAVAEVCSPEHMLMNWFFVFLGVAIAIGAICLHRQWPPGRRANAVTVLWVIYGCSSVMAGAVPADVHFLGHTFLSVPGMIVQIPALLLLAGIVREHRPRLATWTYIWAALNITTLVVLTLSGTVDLPVTMPGGLFQRALYFTVIAWAIGAAILTARRPQWAVPGQVEEDHPVFQGAGSRRTSGSGR